MPSGDIVLVALSQGVEAGTPAPLLDDVCAAECEAALKMLGASPSVSAVLRFGSSYALIGVKGDRALSEHYSKHLVRISHVLSPSTAAGRSRGTPDAPYPRGNREVWVPLANTALANALQSKRDQERPREEARGDVISERVLEFTEAEWRAFHVRPISARFPHELPLIVLSTSPRSPAGARSPPKPLRPRRHALLPAGDRTQHDARPRGTLRLSAGERSPLLILP